MGAQENFAQISAYEVFLQLSACEKPRWSLVYIERDGIGAGETKYTDKFEQVNILKYRL